MEARGTWHDAVNGVTKSRTRLGNGTTARAISRLLWSCHLQSWFGNFSLWTLMLFLSPSCPYSLLHAHTQPHLWARLTGHTCVLESPSYISQRYTATLGLEAPWWAAVTLPSCFRGLVIACKAQGIWDPLPEQGHPVSGERVVTSWHACWVPLRFCFPVVCGVLWWLYYDYTNDLSIELDTERENMKCLLGFAIVSTVITVRSTFPAVDQVACQNSEVQTVAF